MITRTAQCLLAGILLLSLTAQAQDEVISTLEIYDLETGTRTVILEEDRHFEAPNWGPDGSYFLINQAGSLYTVDMEGEKRLFNTGSATRCNNDHGFSPDGSTLAFSNNLEGGPDDWLSPASLPFRPGVANQDA